MLGIPIRIEQRLKPHSSFTLAQKSKYYELTFTERDEGDYYASHHLEDFITKIKGIHDAKNTDNKKRCTINHRNY